MITIHIGSSRRDFSSFNEAIRYLRLAEAQAQSQERTDEAFSQPIEPEEHRPMPSYDAPDPLPSGGFSGGGGSFGGGGASGSWSSPSPSKPSFGDVKSGGSSTAPGGKK